MLLSELNFWIDLSLFTYRSEYILGSTPHTVLLEVEPLESLNSPRLTSVNIQS